MKKNQAIWLFVNAFWWFISIFLSFFYIDTNPLLNNIEEIVLNSLIYILGFIMIYGHNETQKVFEKMEDKDEDK